jgi:hypothetical protein
MKVPGGIKTNSMPRELRKTFSEAEISRGDRILSMKMMKNKVNNLPDSFKVFLMTIPSLSFINEFTFNSLTITKNQFKVNLPSSYAMMVWEIS